MMNAVERAWAAAIWRDDTFGTLTPGDRVWPPWRDGEAITSHGLPPIGEGSTTWRRGIWTGGLWEADARAWGY